MTDATEGRLTDQPPATGELRVPRGEGGAPSVDRDARSGSPLRPPARIRFRPVVLVGLLAGFLFFSRLGHRDLFSSHEARAAQNAQRMLDTGEWGLPTLFDGQSDLQKPPGYYWLVAAVGWLNGGEVNAWAARLPAAAAGLVTVLLVFLFLRPRAGTPVAATVAAVALATAVHFTAISRIARIDVPLTCAVTASLLAFYRGCVASTASGAEEGGEAGRVWQGRVSVERTSFDRCHQKRELLAPSILPTTTGRPPRLNRLGWHLLSAIAAAVGVMLKGPIALALIGPTAVAFLLVERVASARPDRPRLPLSSMVLGTVVVTALGLPWFLWADRATDGEFVRVFFWHHNVARFAGTAATLASHPWWYYFPRLAADFLPWTPALGFLVVWATRSGHWRNDRQLRFGLVWLVVMFAVLSSAKFKRSDYLLPLFPGAAVAFGCAAEAWGRAGRNPRKVRAAAWAFGTTVAAVVLGWQVMIFAVEPAEQGREEKRAFAEMIRAHAPAPQCVWLFRTESHLLAFHLGPPLSTFVEWMELNDRLAEPGPHFMVMPPEYVYPAQQIVTSRRLVVVARLEDYTSGKPPRPLVFLRSSDSHEDRSPTPPPVGEGR